VLASAGVRLGETYPHPVIDHDFARGRVIAAYRATHRSGTG
jgi:deoxyribodipyrimidine photo-lyase